MSRRHYVYFRVAAGEARDAAAAIGALQSALRARHPGLGAELLRRPEEKDGLVTLMEVWSFGPGQDPAAIEVQAAAVAARWCRGERHLERFDLLGF